MEQGRAGRGNDEAQLARLYREMYAAMIAKDEPELDRLHDDAFVLIHMTGMRQDKRAYIRAIMDGTLNYYSEKTEGIDIDVGGDTATVIGRSRVAAAVFGGGRHTWRLALRLEAKRVDGAWRLLGARASTW